MSGELRLEFIERRTISFNLNQNAADAILHEPLEVEADRQVIHEGSKTDALNNPLNGDCPTLHDPILRMPAMSTRRKANSMPRCSQLECNSKHVWSKYSAEVEMASYVDLAAWQRWGRPPILVAFLLSPRTGIDL